MTRLRLLREAEEELRAAAGFYESEQRGLGRALLHEVRRTLRFIAQRPEASRADRGEVRVRTVRVSRIASTIEQQTMKSSLLLLAIGVEDPDFGVPAESHNNQMQRTVRNKVPASYVRRAAAQLRRYTAKKGADLWQSKSECI
jgi:hypothetical protein